MKKGIVAIIITVIVCITIITVVGIVFAFDWLGNTTKDLMDGTVAPTSSDRLMVGTDNLTTDDIKGIRIEWISGNVTVKCYDGENIAVSESNVEEKYQMQCYKEEGYLIIQEFKDDINNVKVKKNLEVYLPTDFSMDKFTVDTVGGTINANEISAKNIVLDTVSANINMDFKMVPSNINVNSVSGNVVLTLPNNIAGFSVDKDTVSGRVNTKDFGGKETYGDGSTLVDFDSVSGTLKLQKASEISLGDPSNHVG